MRYVRMNCQRSHAYDCKVVIRSNRRYLVFYVVALGNLEHNIRGGLRGITAEISSIYSSTDAATPTIQPRTHKLNRLHSNRK